MSESFDLPQVDRLTADAVGPAGHRVFYLQARRGPELVSLKLEKQQVAALAGYLTAMLADLPAVADAGDDATSGEMGLEAPVESAWTVGSIGVAYDEQTDRIVILVEELVEEDDDEGGDDELDDEEKANTGTKVPWLAIEAS